MIAVAGAYPRHLVLAGLVLGLVLGGAVGASPVVVLAVAAGAALAVWAVVAGGRVLPVAVGGAVLIAAAGGGLRARALAHTELAGVTGHVVRGTVTITQAPRPQAFGGWVAQARYRGEPVLLRIPAAGGFRAVGAASGPGSAVATEAAPVEIGEVVRVRAAVRPPDAYAQIVRAHAVLRAFDLTPTGWRRGGWAGAVDGIRRRAERALTHGRDPTRTALLKGMVLGQDSGLPTDVRDEVRAAGLSHLTAASGANVVLLATLVLGLAAVVGVPFHARWLVVLGLIAVYVPLAGGGPSIQRAGVMGAAGVVAVLAGRPSARWYALGLAAVATLGADPRAAGDPGWQMSFAAVAALTTLAAPWAKRLTDRRLPGPVAEGLAVTFAATLATAPVIALHFGTVAPLSVPANLLVAPIVAPIMWLGFVAASLGTVAPPLAGLLDGLAGPLLGWVLAVAHRAADGPGAALHVGAATVLVLALCAVAALGVGRPVRLGVPGSRLRRLPLALPAVMIAVAVLVGVRLAAPPGPAAAPPVVAFRVSALDVGQGDATLLQAPGHAILVDTGPPDAPLLDELDRAGVRRLDALVITHAQLDHDGAAAAVLDALPVGLLLDGRDGVRTDEGDRIADVARTRGVAVTAARAGQEIRAGALSFSVLSPATGATSGATGDDPNQRAIVARAAVEGHAVLLTADAESDVLAGLDLDPVDVLKVAHHGSADDGLPALLERLRPLVAAIEVGAYNTYGHPAVPTLRALRAVPRTVRTDQQGTVRLDLTPAGAWTVTPERAAPPGGITGPIHPGA